jgi:hypothetical protein
MVNKNKKVFHIGLTAMAFLFEKRGMVKQFVSPVKTKGEN